MENFLGLSIEMWAAILGIGLAISELLSLNPKIKANGIFQFIWNALKSVKEKIIKK